PQFLLAGIILPREQLPGALEAIGDWLPLSHAIDALSDAAAGTVDSATASSMLVIAAWIAAALIVGSLTLRRRTA
ncbi:MAG: ABC transporter permease, partial [Glutamicibacter sp.]